MDVKLDFCGLLLIAFIVLKLCGIITWPWIWVLAPLWLGLALFLGVMLFVALGAFLVLGAVGIWSWLFERKKK